MQGVNDSTLPLAHTCFFNLELPEYSKCVASVCCPPCGLGCVPLNGTKDGGKSLQGRTGVIAHEQRAGLEIS